MPGFRPEPSPPERGPAIPDGPRSFIALAPAHDDQAASILAPCTPDGNAATLAALRADPDTALYGAFAGDDLVALYALRTPGLTVELTLLVVAPAHRRRGHGRACLDDALRRAGKRPLVAETDAATLPFYTAAGFKLVGKRRHPSGALRYRLGWHAPRPSPVAGATNRHHLKVLPAPSRGSGIGGEGHSSGGMGTSP